MTRGGPEFWPSILVALGLALGAAAFFVALVGRPTWAVRFGAVGLVLVILLLVAVWHWGFREGAEWRTTNSLRQEKAQAEAKGPTQRP